MGEVYLCIQQLWFLFKDCCSTLSKSSFLNGLNKKLSIPHFTHSSITDDSLAAVNAIMGMCPPISFSFCRIEIVAWIPSSTGIITSYDSLAITDQICMDYH